MWGRKTGCFLLFLALFSSLCFADDYPKDCAPKAGNAASDVANFHVVDSDLYRSARPPLRDDVYLDLARLGVRTIINLEGGSAASKEEAEIQRVNQILRRKRQRELVFISFPIPSFMGTKVWSIPEDGENGLRALFERMQNAPKPILLHCKHGKDRTGAVVMLYRLERREAGSLEDAYDEARHYHFSALNFGLKRTANHYLAARETLTSWSQPAPKGVCHY